MTHAGIKTEPTSYANKRFNVKPVYQTQFGMPNGNCFAACVASILELKIEDIPNFCAIGDENWLQLASNWMLKHAEMRILSIQFASIISNQVWDHEDYNTALSD